jgi:hypothetical protein
MVLLGHYGLVLALEAEWEASQDGRIQSWMRVVLMPWLGRS